MRNPHEFYRHVDTASGFNSRLRIFADVYRGHRLHLDRSLQVLDVGCGRKALLSSCLIEGDLYVGCDIAHPDPEAASTRFEVIDLNEDSLAKRFAGEKFDVVFCGEVIEHLFSPDALLIDIAKLMPKDGTLILSTPNLGYWINRLLLLFGISPLFLENSSQRKLGRRFRILGQDNPTEGHIRLFTFRALLDLMERSNFEVLRKMAAPVWRTGIDSFLSHVAPSLAPDLILVAQPT